MKIFIGICHKSCMILYQVGETVVSPLIINHLIYTEFEYMLIELSQSD